MRYQRSRRITDAQRSVTEDTYLNSLRQQQHIYQQPKGLIRMNPEDTARCQQAIELANSGKRQQAHTQFCFLHDHGNAENVTLLFWLARTTPFLEEAQRMARSIERLEPHHPDLPGLRIFVSTWERKGASAGKGRPTRLPLVIGLILGVTLIAAILQATLSPARSPVTPTAVPYSSTQTDDPTDPSLTSPNTIPSTPVYPSGSGFTVECRDGTYSHAGGKRGACSQHGGEIHP